MHVQEKKEPNQLWFPTQYRLTKEEMGHIMVDWDEEWKNRLAEVEPSEKKNPKFHEVYDEGEEGDTQEKGNGTSETTQQKKPHREEEERTRDREICATIDKVEGHQGSSYLVVDRGIFREYRRLGERIHC